MVKEQLRSKKEKARRPNPLRKAQSKLNSHAIALDAWQKALLPGQPDLVSQKITATTTASRSISQMKERPRRGTRQKHAEQMREFSPQGRLQVEQWVVMEGITGPFNKPRSPGH
jgi:hypothetical protein